MPKSSSSAFSIVKRGKTTFYVKDKDKDVLLSLDIDSLRKEALEKGDIRSGREPHAVIHVPELTNEKIIIRHSRHGGLFGYIAGDIYCKENRFLNELIASETAIKKGVNTAEIIAVIRHRAFGPFYRFEVLSKEISNSLDLIELLTNPPLLPLFTKGGGRGGIKFSDRKNIIEVVAQAIKKMHDAGLYHTDLHLKNILIQHTSDNDLKAYIIDMDKTKRMDVVSTRLRMRNLSRLDRSVEKLKANAKFENRVIPSKADKLRFLMAYIGGDIEMKQYMKMPTRTYWMHRLLRRVGLS
jgi:serine/threonine protein kinase